MATKSKKTKKETEKKESPVVSTASQGLPTQTGEKYYEAIGRRKSAIARVRIYTKKSSDLSAPENINEAEDKAMLTVNNRDYVDYFHRNEELQSIAESPLKKLKSINRFKATVKVSGGGIHGQAEAIRHGLARALILFDENFAKKLKKSGYLTRDSREKERRKYGLKKARKAPQWAKR